MPLFVVDEAIRRTGYVCANRAAFLAASLRALDDGLRELGGRLVVRRGEVVEQVRQVAEDVGARQVHVAADVSGYSRRRARKLADALAADGRELVEHDAVVTVQHRYDPDGDYVRRYVPELADVPGGAVHEPWRLDTDTHAGLDYPDPIVDLGAAAQHFLAARGKV